MGGLAQLVHSVSTAFAPGERPTTRFAPSPNGPLHLGHAWAAIAAHDLARAMGGRFLLRIEDIDGTRSRPEHVAGIIADMNWLGLACDAPPLFQSGRIAAYAAARDRLAAAGLAYPCFCSRGDIRVAIAATPVRHGPDGPVYPGTCRALSRSDAEARIAAGAPHGWRLDAAGAVARLGGAPGWTDLAAGPQPGDAHALGDILLWRRDAPASYHLAVVVDDAASGIDTIVRGRDLLAYSGMHRLLQRLLGLPEPRWWHHSLLLGQDGEKLAKSRGSLSLADLRRAGMDGRALADALRAGTLPTGISRDDV